MKLFIGIPTSRHYKPFWDSMEIFIPLLEKEHELEIYTLANKSLAEARNTIVSRFLNSDKDYLLFLDDDHSGHSLEMFNALLNPLINNNRNVCAIKCYTKFFPYNSTLLEYDNIYRGKLNLPKGIGNYRPIDDYEGYVECDLVGFGMTLISRETFSKIEEPYFSSKDNRREDNYFCEKLLLAGIKPIGCFDYILEHNGIGKHNASILRNQEMKILKETIIKHNPNIENIVLVS